MTRPSAAVVVVVVAVALFQVTTVVKLKLVLASFLGKTSWVGLVVAVEAVVLVSSAVDTVAVSFVDFVTAVQAAVEQFAVDIVVVSVVELALPFAVEAVVAFVAAAVAAPIVVDIVAEPFVVAAVAVPIVVDIVAEPFVVAAVAVPIVVDVVSAPIVVDIVVELFVVTAVAVLFAVVAVAGPFPGLVVKLLDNFLYSVVDIPMLAVCNTSVDLRIGLSDGLEEWFRFVDRTQFPVLAVDLLEMAHMFAPVADGFVVQAEIAVKLVAAPVACCGSPLD